MLICFKAFYIYIYIICVFSGHTKYVEVICEPMKLEGQKLVEAGVHPDVLEYAISLACEEVKKYLKSIARRISTFEEIAQVYFV